MRATAFLKVTTAAGKNLTLTKGHHVPVGAECCSTLKTADELDIGETVWVVGPNHAAASTTVKAISKVRSRRGSETSHHLPHAFSRLLTPSHTFDRVAVSKVIAAGLHSPVLLAGSFPIVDGVVTSFDSIDKVVLAKHGLEALITACKATGTCDEFKHTFLSGADRHYVA